MSDRYPTLAATVLPPAAGPAPSGVFDREHSNWRPLTLGRDQRSEQRDLTDRVRLVVAPGPGGRWDSWVLADTDIRQLPLAANSAAAKSAAETEGWRTIVQLAAQAPQLADELIHDAPPEAHSHESCSSTSSATVSIQPIVPASPTRQFKPPNSPSCSVLRVC